MGKNKNFVHQYVKDTKIVGGIITWRKYSKCTHFDNVMPTLDARLGAASEDDYEKIQVAHFRFMLIGAHVSGLDHVGDIMQDLVDASDISVDIAEDTTTLKYEELVCYTDPSFWRTPVSGHDSLRTRWFIAHSVADAEAWVRYFDALLNDESNPRSLVIREKLSQHPTVSLTNSTPGHNISVHELPNIRATLDYTKDYLSYGFGSRIVPLLRDLAENEACYLASVTLNAELNKARAALLRTRQVKQRTFHELPSLTELSFPEFPDLIALSDPATSLNQRVGRKKKGEEPSTSTHTFLFFDRDAALDWLTQWDELLGKEVALEQEEQARAMALPPISVPLALHPFAHVSISGAETYVRHIEELHVEQRKSLEAVLQKNVGFKFTVSPNSLAAKAYTTGDLLREAMLTGYVQHYDAGIAGMLLRGKVVFTVQKKSLPPQIGADSFGKRWFIAVNETHAVRWAERLNDAVTKLLLGSSESDTTA